MDYIVTLQTGTGFWNPIAWSIAFIVAIVIVLVIWLRGEKGHREGTAQRTPYLSGNAPPSNRELHVPGGSLYWGFTEALSGYYSRLVPLHSGIINDYVMWFLGVMAFLLIIVGVLS